MRLTLSVKSEYFDEIKCGAKTVEYRLVNAYWTKRLVNRNYSEIVITKGYPRINDKSRRMHFPYHGYAIENITHPIFGEKSVSVFALSLRVDQ